MTLDTEPVFRLEPFTLAERAEVGEDYFRACFRYALASAVALAGVAVALSYGDSQHGAFPATAALAFLIAILAVAFWIEPDSSLCRHRSVRVHIGDTLLRRADGYAWLRRYPYALALPGPGIACVCLWHAVDANALYFPVLAPLALVPCVAQGRREEIAVVVSLAAGTFLAALEDSALPRLHSAGELASSTLAVVVMGVLLAVIVDWWARMVLLAPDTTTTSPSESSRPVDIVPGAGPAPNLPAEQLHRIRVASMAPPDAFEDLQIRGMARLTGRQIQLLYLLREGLSYADIACCLHLSAGTVRSHVGKIRIKLGAVGAGAATYVIANQLPPLPEGFPAHPENPCDADDSERPLA